MSRVAEERIRAGASTGGFVDLLEGSNGDIDLYRLGDENCIGAAWLADLLSGRSEDGLHPRGLIIRGVRLTGSANWHGIELIRSLTLKSCVFDEELNLARAEVVSLQLENCIIPAITATELRVNYGLCLDRSRIFGKTTFASSKIGGNLSALGTQFGIGKGLATCFDGENCHIAGDLELAEEMTTFGEMRLVDARIEGGFRLSGATLSNLGGMCIFGDRIAVGGSVELSTGDDGHGLTSAGEIRLAAASIRGQLVCAGAALRNERGSAVSLDNATIGRDVYLDGIRAKGAVSFAGARISGALSATGGQVANEDGEAFSLTDATVERDVYLDGGFKAVGAVSLYDASLGGLYCSGGTFSNPKKIALGADRATIRANVRLDGDGQRPFTADGAVSFQAAHIGGGIVAPDARLSNEDGSAFNGAGLEVKGTVYLGGGFSAVGARAAIS